MAEARVLLLTDVVDSTKLVEALGTDRAAALWAAHDRVARDLLEPHRGREIDKTDGFLLMFESVADALAYALAYHRAIGALDPPIRSRAGIHVGDVVVRENAPADVARGAKPLEVEGIAKPTAARVMSLASAGQTLLSNTARDALGDTPWRVVGHGHWRLKGVTEPIELFEVGDEEAPFTPPPDAPKAYRVLRRGDLWEPVREIAHSLPRERDGFVGRREDLLALAERIEQGAALVSVLGIGGTGKTRLVVRYGWTWLGDWPGGVWFCDLSEARGVDGICEGVARSLGIPLADADPVVQLGHAIAGRGECLMILDNFEQVAAYVGDTVERWLDRATQARFVVTTREVLGIAGETTLALPPLTRDAAVELFETRAKQARREFAMTSAERRDVEALVDLLDRLPLAIELAAARVRVMPPGKLLTRMNERFRLLAGTGTARTRHATLRAAMDWSWDLLSADERAGLAQLSVFEGGFTLEAAEGVLALEAAWPMDVVQGLVDKSLVRRVDETRFDLLVSVQEYGAERLVEMGGTDQARERHGAYFAELGGRASWAALRGEDGVALWQGRLRDLDNLIAASQRAVARCDGSIGAATALAAWSVLALRGPLRRGIAVLEAARAQVFGDPALEAQIEHALGEATQSAGDLRAARAHLDAALHLERDARSRDPGLGPGFEAWILSRMADLLTQVGEPDPARERFEQAVVCHRAAGDRAGEAHTLARFGLVELGQGRIDEASRRIEAALGLARAAGDRRGEAQALHARGSVHRDVGRLEAARSDFEVALGIARDVGDRAAEAARLSNLGMVALRQDRGADAEALSRAALAIHREIGDRASEARVLEALGNGCRREGRHRDALRYALQAREILVEIGDRAGEGATSAMIGLAHYYLRELDQVEGHLQHALNIARELRNRPNEANVVSNLGNLYRLLGRSEDARRCFEQGLAIHLEVRNARSAAIVLDNLGVLSALGERWEEALGHYRAASQLAEQAGHRRHLGSIRAVTGHVLIQLGRYDEADAELDASEVILSDLDEQSERVRVWTYRAEIRLALGDASGARAFATRALELVDALGDRASEEIREHPRRVFARIAQGAG